MKPFALPPSDAAAQDEADAREFDEYAKTQDPVLLKAALWATRREAGLNAAKEAEFQAWLKASPEHLVAYQEMAGSLDPVKELPDARIQQLKDETALENSAKQNSPQHTPPQKKPESASPDRQLPPSSRGRRAWLAGLGRAVPQAAMAFSVVALVGGGWLGWDHYQRQPVFAKDYATQKGQGLSIQLPDGSNLQLDVSTQAQVRLYRDRREVRLLDGQAMFTVQPDVAKPFDVLAGLTRVTVVGTRFSVRHTRTGLEAGKTVVAVESGRVRVSRDGQDNLSGAVELTAGQTVSADQAGLLQGVSNIPASSVAAWRKGRISFNDTPLSEALAELERYGDTGLVVLDPAVGALRLGGSFDLKQVGTFAQALPSLLPVRLERRANGQLEIVARR